MKTAFITGIGGQDGYFLARFLFRKGYKVYGLVRSFESEDVGNLSALPKDDFKKIKLLRGDINNTRLLSGYIKKYRFGEVYHLAGQSSIHPSLKDPSLAYRDNIDSVLTLLNAIKDLSRKTKLFVAASSELFGDAMIYPQNEKTPFFPRNPYGFSKLAAVRSVKYYRENYKIFACSGILYNHESEMRGEQFVTRKISIGVARVYAGLQKEIVLGDVSAKRDWGYAGDYVEAMWKMLQQKKPDDYVIATGKLHSVRDFIDEAFRCVGIKLAWIQSKGSYRAVNVKTKQVIVKAAASGNVPGNAPLLVGDVSKARKVLHWSPGIDFKKLVKIMVMSDVKKYNNQ
jgi:GDPmannose 4,6-dehydratase